MAHLVMLARPDDAFWRGRRVLLTGHTGFKGGWLAQWLARLGAVTTGLSLAPTAAPSLFETAGVRRFVDGRIADIRDADLVQSILRDVKPEVVFHLAAQPLVRRSYDEPLETFASNVMGTAHVLEAIRHCESVRVAVMITTDKVYANREWIYPYRETDALGGHDPYAASKAACELVIDSYRQSFLTDRNVAVASARAGNVIGGGDWSVDRLLPDAVRAWTSGQVLRVRRPSAVRPWQHVLEPLRAYLELAQRMWNEPSLAQPFNIGPLSSEHASVASVVDIARTCFGEGLTTFDDEMAGPHESGLLSLETAKARELLGTRPVWDLETAIAKTMNWYRQHRDGADAADLCDRDIALYESRT